MVSAHSGQGIDQLLAKIDDVLPGPSVMVTVEIPYNRGDLVSRILQTGIVERQEHTERGTVLVAKVDSDLAADIRPFLQDE